uniref:Uncharacterized protein n=1 Tax=Oncorhynchus mykiss TaxID=8022 RepID=A0A8K9X0S9_ONCMY
MLTCLKVLLTSATERMTHLIDQLLVFIETSGDCVWRLIRGKFLAINAAGMNCACPCSPRGLFLSFIHVISEVDPSETSGKKICNQVCMAHPSYDTGHNNWNSDGEIMPHAAIHVRYAIRNLNLLVLLRDLGV